MDGEAAGKPTEAEAGVVETPPTEEPLQFIRDEPAVEDFFRTHTALAKAITQTIITNPLLRTIGLLGRWGSGKSTVLHQLEKELSNTATDRFHVFTYDAWLHQHDPVRRSFIEELVAFADQQDWEQPVEIDEEIKRLLGQVQKSDVEVTPRLTPDARAMLVSLLPVPVGLAVLRLDVIKGAFGKDATLAATITFWLAATAILTPVWAWSLRYVCRRPWKDLGWSNWPLSRPQWTKFFQITDPDGHPSAVIPTLINQSIKRTSTRTLTLPEPTTIEFGRFFRSVVKGLSASGRRLIIVIDNLDRVPEEEALQIWATIRSFFSSPSNEGTDGVADPLVLLPIDRTAIQRMFARSHGVDSADELAESFVHKTFEVTFEVTQPVMSDWRDYLAKQMAFAFRKSLGENWTFWTRKFFERKQQEKGFSPTPRQINRMINRLVASYMQWGGDVISFPLQAYFIIFHDEIDKGFATFIVSDQPELAKISTRWQEQIAALRYGVDVSKAIQTLLDRPVRLAIQTGSLTEVEGYEGVPGFDDSLELISSDLSFAETDGAADFAVVRNFVGLMDGLNRPANEATDQIWRNLVTYYCTLKSVDFRAAGGAIAVSALAAHVPRELADRFAEVGTNAVAMGLQAETNEGQAEVRKAGIALIEFCQASGRELPFFSLGKVGMLVILRIAQADTTRALLRQYWSPVTADDLDRAFAEGVRDQLQAPGTQQAFTAILAEADAEMFTKIDNVRTAAWSDTLSACSEALRQSMATPQMVPANDLLFAAMPHSELAKDIVRQAAQDGTYSARLTEAVADGDLARIARFCAALLWAEVDFAPPQPWSEMLRKHADMARQITLYLRAIQGPSTIAVIWKAYEASKASRELVQALMEYGIVQNDLGRLNPRGITDHLAYYIARTPYRLIDQFIARIASYNTFWEHLPEVEAASNFQRAALALAKDKSNRGKIEAIVRSKIDGLSAAQWTQIVESGVEPYPVIHEIFGGKPLDFGKSSAIFDGLEKSVPLLFAGDRMSRVRWSALREHFKAPAKKSLLDAVVQAILRGQVASETLSVLKALGNEILHSPLWLRSADATLHEVVIKQAASKPGRAWLKKNSARVKIWIGRAEPEAKQALADFLHKMESSKNDERRYWAEVCLHDWKL